MTLTIKSAKALAQQQGLDNLDTDVLLAQCLNKDRAFLFTWPDHVLNPDQDRLFHQWVADRLTGKPIAYILGYKEFWSLSLKTNSTTLIPRPDTEVLVETVLANHDACAIQCVDLGTGTGAIALALKSERLDWTILGVDRIESAVQLATLNALNLQLDVSFSLGDWCADIDDNSFDIVVSNPPYIDENDTHLVQGDVVFEPTSALVSNDTGLADIKIISVQAKRVLRPLGFLYFEHGWTQASAVQNILALNGFINIKTRKDYGGNDRVTYGQLQA